MEDFIKLIKKLSIVHPAREMEFSDLTQGLFTEVEKGNINVNYHPQFPHLALFKYTHECATERKWNKFSLMARGLILDLQNKVVVATPFIKFFNFGEIESGSTSIIQSEFIVTEKADGCCHQDTILLTEDGEMTIKEICDKKYKGKILSYDIYSDKCEFKEIEGYFVSTKKNQWYELELEDGTKVKLTGNHKVYLPELNCYRRVDELKETEKFLLKK